jgi:predicted RNase H-like HicB family nuclease
MASEFVVHRLRAKPVEYSVSISHYVRDGQWVMRVAEITGVATDRENMLRVAADLRKAAEWLEEDFGGTPAEDNPIPPKQDGSLYVTSGPQPLLASDDAKDA